MRKTVSVLFCDVTGSTELGERLDAETMHQVLSRHFDVARGIVEAHGGTLEKYIGDALMAVFGVPTLHEDDALRAVRAAVDMRDALPELNAGLAATWGVELQTRTGIATGEVIAADPSDGRLVSGDMVNAAARLEQAAEPGEILVDDATLRAGLGRRLGRRARDLQARGKRQTLLVRSVLGVDERPRRCRAASTSGLSDASGSWLSCATRTTARSPTVPASCSRCSAPPASASRGWGRSSCTSFRRGRVLWSAAASPTARGSRSGRWRRSSATWSSRTVSWATSWPVSPDADLVERLVAGAIGSRPTSAQREETFWAVRRLLEAAGARRPLVVVFEDIHWAEPTLLDLVEYLADWVRDTPIMLLCLARPELLDSRRHLGRREAERHGCAVRAAGGRRGRRP